MRILHALSQRPDSTGSGIYIQAMLREAAASGHENFLLAGIQKGQEPDLDEPPHVGRSFVEFGGEDIDFPIVGMSDVMPYASVRFRDLGPRQLDAYETAFGERLERVVADFRPELIHSHHLWLLSSLIRSRFAGLPVVANCHGSDLRQFRNCPHLRERVLAGCRDLDGVVVLSRAMRDDVLGLYGIPEERVHVIGAGYDDRLFRPAVKPPCEPVQVLYAGKLSRAKGVPWLLRALGRLESGSWRLHLVGSGGGPEADECLALARELGPSVEVHGAVPQTTLAELMRASHLFVLPSFFEGLPLVVVEALATGCAVVATDLPGIRELVGGAPESAVRRIALPRLEDSDRPLAQDEEVFTARLAAALAGAIADLESGGGPDPDALEPIVSACRWPGIFARVGAIWQEAKDARSARG